MIYFGFRKSTKVVTVEEMREVDMDMVKDEYMEEVEEYHQLILILVI